LEGLKGKVVFLDFWATWCPPCVISIPEVKTLYESYKDKNVEIISISLDQDESAVRKFVNKHHMKNRIAMGFESDIGSRYGIDGIPAFFIIDKKGNIVRAWGGYSYSFPDLWRKELDRLLKT
jgi:thiol-disulfide isomerase/thioredoxin